MTIKNEVLKEINKRFNVDSTDLMESEKVIDLTLKKVEELIDEVFDRYINPNYKKQVRISILDYNNEELKKELKQKLGETG